MQKKFYASDAERSFWLFGSLDGDDGDNFAMPPYGDGRRNGKRVHGGSLRNADRRAFSCVVRRAGKSRVNARTRFMLDVRRPQMQKQT